MDLQTGLAVVLHVGHPKDAFETGLAAFALLLSGAGVGVAVLAIQRAVSRRWSERQGEPK